MAGSRNQGKIVNFHSKMEEGGPEEKKASCAAALCGGQEETAGLQSGSIATTTKEKATVEEEEGSAHPRRVLLSGQVGTSRVKKRRRSRATSKAPIKMFCADASNFMAMVHRLTGIPSHTFHLLTPPPASKPLPFMQGPPTLNTSAMLLPTYYFSGDNELHKLCSFPCLQASSSMQHLGSSCGDIKSLIQAGQLNADSDTNSPFPHLMRNRGSTGSSCASLPSLWEASEVKQKSFTHKLQENCINGREGTFRQALHHGIASEVNLSSLESLLARRDGLASVDSWLSSTTSNIAKEELA